MTPNSRLYHYNLVFSARGLPEEIGQYYYGTARRQSARLQFI
jgi:hypothetical protein